MIMKPFMRRVTSLALILGLSAGIGCDFNPNVKKHYHGKKPHVGKIHKKVLPLCYSPRTNTVSKIERALQRGSSDDWVYFDYYLVKPNVDFSFST